MTITDFEEEVVFDDGARHHLIGNASPLYDEQGQVRGAVAAFRDITERKRAEEALRESAAKFRTAFHYSQAAMSLSTLEEGRYLDVNAEFLRMAGRTYEEVVGRTSLELNMWVHAEQRDQMIAQMREHGALHGYEVEIRAKSGGVLTVLWAADQVVVNGEACLLVSALDITERKQAEEQLKALLKEREALVREVHHRVKNNFAVVVGLLSLQAAHVADPAARATLTDLQSRVQAMLQVHQRLYQGRDVGCLDFGAYLRDMLAGLHHTYAGGTEIDLLVDAPDICLSVDTAIPCGLLVAELATNAFKHAFPDRDREGEKIVRVEMRAEGERFTLVVADNGVGLPPEMDVYQASSVGLTLVNTFVQQLHGRLQVDTRAGTEFTVTFDAREGDRLAMSQAVE